MRRFEARDVLVERRAEVRRCIRNLLAYVKVARSKESMRILIDERLRHASRELQALNLAIAALIHG